MRKSIATILCIIAANFFVSGAYAVERLNNMPVAVAVPTERGMERLMFPDQTKFFLGKCSDDNKRELNAYHFGHGKFDIEVSYLAGLGVETDICVFHPEYGEKDNSYDSPPGTRRVFFVPEQYD